MIKKQSHTLGKLLMHLFDKSSEVAFNALAVSVLKSGLSIPIMPWQKPNAHSEELLVKHEL